MAINFYGATSLIGGATGALDVIDGTDLANGDGAVVITDSVAYFYHLNATSGEGESSPDIIAPDSNAGDKRWILDNVYGAGHQYVDNVDSTIDWALGDVTCDGTWRDLDCSGVVPAGAVAINFHVYFRHPSSAGTHGLIRRNGNSNSDNVISSYIYVAGITTRFMGVVACDSNRKCEYNFSAGMNLIGICIMGWFV